MFGSFNFTPEKIEELRKKAEAARLQTKPAVAPQAVKPQAPQAVKPQAPQAIKPQAPQAVKPPVAPVNPHFGRFNLTPEKIEELRKQAQAGRLQTPQAAPVAPVAATVAPVAAPQAVKPQAAPGTPVIPPFNRMHGRFNGRLAAYEAAKAKVSQMPAVPAKPVVTPNPAVTANPVKPVNPRLNMMHGLRRDMK